MRVKNPEATVFTLHDDYGYVLVGIAAGDRLAAFSFAWQIFLEEKTSDLVMKSVRHLR